VKTVKEPRPKKRMGRPPKAPGEKRILVHFYATVDEKALLEAKAESEGMPLSVWIRKKLIEK
jgi:hypothetical protein